MAEGSGTGSNSGFLEQLKTRQGTELLIQSENDGVVSEWFRMLQDAISTHVSGSGLGAWWRSTDQPPSAGRVVSLFQAWESDEAIEEDMPESPVEKHDKDKEHRDAKKSRGVCGHTPVWGGDQWGTNCPCVLSGSHEELHQHGLLRQQEDQTQAEEVPDPPAHAAGRPGQGLHQR